MNTPGHAALIVGAGAVENAWNPVIRALKTFAIGSVTPYNANTILARMVRHYRFFTRHATDENPPPINFPKQFRDMKAAIASEVLLAETSGELKARTFLKVIMRELILPISPVFTFVTTNWDRVIEQAIVRSLMPTHVVEIPAFHLHGTCESADSLYLPSEESVEPYREDGIARELLGRHLGVIEALNASTRLIIYGLSLSPLDTELCDCIAEGVADSSIREIYIIDPDHARVAQLLHVILFDPNPLKIYGIDPTDIRYMSAKEAEQSAAGQREGRLVWHPNPP